MGGQKTKTQTGSGGRGQGRRGKGEVWEVKERVRVVMALLMELFPIYYGSRAFPN